MSPRSCTQHTLLREKLYGTVLCSYTLTLTFLQIKGKLDSINDTAETTVLSFYVHTRSLYFTSFFLCVCVLLVVCPPSASFRSSPAIIIVSFLFSFFFSKNLYSPSFYSTHYMCICSDCSRCCWASPVWPPGREKKKTEPGTAANTIFSFLLHENNLITFLLLGWGRRERQKKSSWVHSTGLHWLFPLPGAQ